MKKKKNQGAISAGINGGEEAILKYQLKRKYGLSREPYEEKWRDGWRRISPCAAGVKKYGAFGSSCSKRAKAAGRDRRLAGSERKSLNNN